MVKNLIINGAVKDLKQKCLPVSFDNYLLNGYLYRKNPFVYLVQEMVTFRRNRRSGSPCGVVTLKIEIVMKMEIATKTLCSYPAHQKEAQKHMQ